MHHIAAIAQHLDLDVTRPPDEALEVDTPIAERRLRFRLRDAHLLAQLLGIVGYTYSTSTSARRSFDHHGVADLGCGGHGAVECLHYAVAPRDRGHPGLRCRLARERFVAHDADHLRRGPDEDEA